MGTIPTPPPRCDSLGCSDITCCPGKQAWPELVGRKALEVREIIEKENPNVKVVIASKDVLRFADLCCNIVWIYVDGQLKDGVITSVPRVG